MLRGLFFNQDSTDFFYSRSKEQMTGADVDAFVDRLAGLDISALLVNTNAQRTNYASEVWEPFWKGYDPAGPDDQPVLRHLPADRIPGTRRLLDNMIALAAAGVDYPARMLERCRQRGIQGWISLRMNDLHDVDLPDSPLLSTFWKSHPQFRRVPHRFQGWPDRALDYAHAEVRDHYLALIEESLARFDPDGLELDFLRFGYHFRIGHEREGGRILTGWLGQVRDRVRDWGRRRGHEISLGVRVAADPIASRELGMDAVTWAREGLCDLIVPTPFWTTCDFDLPMELWRDLLAGSDTALGGGLECRYQPSPAAPARMVTPEEARGAAVHVWSGGADVLYLFNYFESMHFGGAWTAEQYDRTLRAMGSLEGLVKLPRTHVVTFRDTPAPGVPVAHALPAQGPLCAFRLQTGPRPASGAAEVVLGLEVPEGGAAPHVRVNGHLCEEGVLADGVQRTPVPLEALGDQITVIEVESPAPHATTTSVGLSIAP